MKVFFKTIVIVFFLSGCSVKGEYLKPESTTGSLNMVYPKCGGFKKVIEFFPLENEDWLVFQVYAKLPGKFENSTAGTKLRAYFKFRYNEWSYKESPLFKNKIIHEKNRRLMSERKKKKYTIRASSPFITVIHPNGKKEKVLFPFFEKEYKNGCGVFYDFRGSEVYLSQDRLENFTIVFPDIYLNNKKFYVPPIKFNIKNGSYTYLLNC